VREPERRERLPDSALRPGLAAAVAYLKQNAVTFAAVVGAFALIQVVDYGLTSWLPSLLFRRFGLTPAKVGASVGPIAIIGGLLGALVGGIAADTLQSRGFADAKLRVAAISATFLLPLVCFPLLSSAPAVLSVFAGYTFVVSVLGAVGLSAVQDVAPSDMRGLMVSLQAFAYTLLGLGCGPTLVAAVNDHVMHSPLQIGTAMALVAVPFAAVGVALLWSALPAFRVTRSRLAGRRTAIAEASGLHAVAPQVARRA
jgi:MFS family permease